VEKKPCTFLGDFEICLKRRSTMSLEANVNTILHLLVIGRVYTHKNDFSDGFTKRYHIHSLVYFEVTEDINSAMAREKQIKKWNRAWKIALIEKNNPKWLDLYYDLIK